MGGKGQGGRFCIDVCIYKSQTDSAIQTILTTPLPDDGGGQGKMDFEWDEAKRILVIAKRGLDFLRVAKLLEGPHLRLPARSDSEPRQIAVAKLDERMIVVVFTQRGERVRLITARRAHDNEIRAYYAHFSG